MGKFFALRSTTGCPLKASAELLFVTPLSVASSSVKFIGTVDTATTFPRFPFLAPVLSTTHTSTSMVGAWRLRFPGRFPTRSIVADILRFPDRALEARSKKAVP